MSTRIAVALACAWLGMAGLACPASAQNFGEAFQGLSTDSNEPIQIEADKLEIRDAEKIAVYSGNVRVQQGVTTLKTTELRVHYSGEAKGSAPGSTVERIEAGSPVLVQSESQTATSNNAVLEMSRDLITMTGNVVLTQDENVVRGERLIVNLKTKQAHMEGGRVQTVITPRNQPGQAGQ